jgi:hypothetical protein
MGDSGNRDWALAPPGRRKIITAVRRHRTP